MIDFGFLTRYTGITEQLFCNKRGPSMPRGKPKDPEAYAKKRAEIARRNWADPEYRKRVGAAISAATKGKKVISEEQRVAISQTLTGRQKPEEERRNQSQGMRDRWASGGWQDRSSPGAPSDEKRQRISESLRGHPVSEDTRAKLSARGRDNWQNMEYRQRMLELRDTYPNGLERSLIPHMELLGFRYTGDGSFWVHDRAGSHNPDFKQTGFNRVVEIWGDYWHRDDDPQAAIAWYAAHGFAALIVWERDLAADGITNIVSRWLTDGILSDDLEGRTYPR
jgi:hypothetical protein